MPHSANKEQGPTVSNVSILPAGDLPARDRCSYNGAVFFFKLQQPFGFVFVVSFYSNLHEEYSRSMSHVLKDTN